MPWDVPVISQAGLSTITVTCADFSLINDSTRVLTLLAANTNRRGATILNETDQDIPVSESGTPSWSSHTTVLCRGESLNLAFPASATAIAAYLLTIPNGRILITERA